MARRPLLLCLIALAGGAGCVGNLDEKKPGQPDGGFVVEPDATPITCEPATTSSGDGHHLPGTSCLDSGCHAPGVGAGPVFTVGGTLYDSKMNGAAVAGGTIHMIDATGTDIILISADNGNFWTVDPVVFPVKTYATVCPAAHRMHTDVTDVGLAGGNCNVSGCHNAGFAVTP